MQCLPSVRSNAHRAPGLHLQVLHIDEGIKAGERVVDWWGWVLCADANTLDMWWAAQQHNRATLWPAQAAGTFVSELHAYATQACQVHQRAYALASMTHTLIHTHMHARSDAQLNPYSRRSINYYSRPAVHWNFSLGASAAMEPVTDTNFRIHPQVRPDKHGMCGGAQPAPPYV